MNTQYRFTGKLSVDGEHTVEELRSWLQEAVCLDIDTESGSQVSDEAECNAIELNWESLGEIMPSMTDDTMDGRLNDILRKAKEIEAADNTELALVWTNATQIVQIVNEIIGGQESKLLDD